MSSDETLSVRAQAHSGRPSLALERPRASPSQQADEPDSKAATYTASIVTPAGSDVRDLAGCRGRSFAYSDPASTSGHLFPAYALKQGSIDPDNGVTARYAGSHTASYEALRAGQVACGEMNSQQIDSAKIAKIYDPAAFRTLWKSEPIPVDPIAVRGNLPEPFKGRLIEALRGLDLSALPADLRGLLPGPGVATQDDAAYNGIRGLVGTLGLDLNKVQG